VRTLKSITFLYVVREDRMLAAINAGHEQAWSCWLTRRIALALLDRASQYLASTSGLAQRAPADLRGETIAFEREAGIAKTARAMSTTPPEVLTASASGAELAERLTIAQQGQRFRLDIVGQRGEGAAGMLTRAELQRILQMLQATAAQAGWLAAPAQPQAAATAAATDRKPARH
jgi:hypothetical protein